MLLSVGKRGARAIAITAAALAVLTVIVAAGWNNGHSAHRVRLLSGAAWLPSSQVGQLTLLDGSSAEVAAQVPVASPGDRLDAAQSGTTGYAINHTTGSIRRVDGGTLEPAAPVTPIPDAAEGLQAYPSADALYALDTHRGVLTRTDSTTLAGRSGPSLLPAQVGVQAAILDDAGRLWVLDNTGNLTWITDGQRVTRPQASHPGSGMLVLADGSPVIIDPQARTAAMLDPETGDTEHTVPLGLDPGDMIQVGGSPRTPRLHIVTSRGVFLTCDLTATSCGDAVSLGEVGPELGPILETGDRVLIPDYTHGRVRIVDLKEKRVVAQPPVLTPAPVRFQLLTRDGIVFFNDPDSERAGVIRPDGSVIHIAKYDPGPSTAPSPDPAASVLENPESTDENGRSTSPDSAATTPPIPDQDGLSPANPNPGPEPGEQLEPGDGSGPGAGPPTGPEQPGPESCDTGDEAELDFEDVTSGVDIPATVDIKCSAPTGRAYAIIVERIFDGVLYYYPKRRIDSDVGIHDGSITIEGSEPHSTRLIYVISIDTTELEALWNRGPDGELTRLPGSYQLASAKYSHTRTD